MRGTGAGSAGSAHETTRRRRAVPLPLFDEPVAPAPPKAERHRIAVNGPESFTFWSAFKRGADGQTPPGVEHDETIARYAADGYNLGRLFQPLPCMKENR